MKKTLYKESIAKLLEEKKTLCEKIIALSIVKYPVNSRVMFKVGNMNSYQAGIILSVVGWWWTSHIPEFIVLNEKTGKARRIDYSDFHEKDQK